MDKFEPLENERWVWCKTFKDDYSHYLVSDKGRCWNCKTKKFVGYWSYYGYWVVGLTKSKKQQELIMIGRLMLISFGIPIPQHLKDLPTNKLKAMHIDGDSHNNNLSNFAWGDNRENQNEVNCRIRKSEAKKGDKAPWYGKYGKNHNRSKPIIQYTISGELIRDWNCAMDVERELGIKPPNISKCCKGIRISAGGYVWKYKEEAV